MSRKRIIIVTLAAIGVLSATAVLAASTPPQLIVPIGSITRADTNPAEYVKAIYQWSIGLAALLAMAQLVVGGVQYILAAGNPHSKQDANERMKAAVSGLIILLSIVIILTAINPKLASIKPKGANNTAIQQAAQARSSADKNLANTLANSAAFRSAAQAAEARIQQDPDQGDCTSAAGKMTEEIYEFVTGDDSDIEEVVGDLEGDGEANGFSDMYEYLEKADNVRTSSPYQYRCYQDALIVAMQYAAQNMTADDFALVIATLKKMPTNFDATEYLKDDPFGRASIAGDVLRKQFIIDQRLNGPGHIRQPIILAEQKIAAKDVAATAATLSAISNDPNRTYDDIAVINGLILEAGDTFTDAQYNQMIDLLKTGLDSFFASKALLVKK